MTVLYPGHRGLIQRIRSPTIPVRFIELGQRFRSGHRIRRHKAARYTTADEARQLVVAARLPPPHIEVLDPRPPTGRARVSLSRGAVQGVHAGSRTNQPRCPPGTVSDWRPRPQHRALPRPSYYTSPALRPASTSAALRAVCAAHLAEPTSMPAVPHLPVATNSASASLFAVRPLSLPQPTSADAVHRSA